MPNTKSAEKRIRQTATRTARNRRIKSIVKTSIHRFEEAVQTGDADTAKAKMAAAASLIDKAAAKGVILRILLRKSLGWRTLNRAWPTDFLLISICPGSISITLPGTEIALVCPLFGSLVN